MTDEFNRGATLAMLMSQCLQISIEIGILCDRITLRKLLDNLLKPLNQPLATDEEFETLMIILETLSMSAKEITPEAIKRLIKIIKSINFAQS